MCGRINRKIKDLEILRAQQLLRVPGLREEWRSHHNIAPTETVYVVADHEGVRA